MPRNVPTSSSLSTSRIQRLLRPLRTHCTAFVNCLAAYTQTTSRAAATGHAKPAEDSAPLQVILPPNTIGIRTRIDKDRIGTLELSRKLYAVKDCFRNIVVNTSAGNPTTPAQEPKSRVMSLTSMCAVIVGEIIEGQCREEVDEDEDIEEVEILAEFYEAIPPEYRRPAVLSHALDIILSSAPHHPTLLSVLLDVCLAHALQRQSDILLTTLLRVAILPQPLTHNPHPPLCHHAHATFLLDLLERWRTAGRLDQEFYNILIQVLEDATCFSVWTACALERIVAAMCKLDFVSFLRLMSCLALQIKKASKSTRQQEAGDNSNSSICLVARQLHRWQGLAFGRILSDVDSSMLFMGDVAATMGLFLSSGLSIRFPSCTPDERYPLEVQDQLLSLATHWLYHCRTQAPADLVSHVIYQLQCSTPRPLTFRGLLRLIAGHMRILLLGDVDEFHERLSRHADLLCSMGLLHLEASLWGCSLRCTESPDKEPLFSEWAAQGIIGKYRRRLIDLVDDAEKRCFGQASGSTPRLGHNIDFAGVETDDEGESIRSKSAGIQWQWEAMIGGWVQVPKATPSIKRPRKVTRQRPAEGDSGDVFDDDSLLKYRQRRKQSLRTSPDKGVGSARVLCIDSSPCASQERNIMASPDELYLGPSIASRLSLYGPQHRTRPTARHSEPMPRTSFDTDIFASPTPLPRSVKLSPYRRPRLSNFTTLLSDAILSRTILHTKRRLVDDTPISTPPRKRPRVAMISQSRARNSRTEIIKTPFDQSPSPLESPEPDEFQAQVIDLDIEIPSCYTPTPVKGYSSDDPLDLFMVDTSPVS